MLFKDVIAHESIKEKFSTLIAEKKLPHAMLLLAPTGAGGLPMALAIAQNLVCEKRNPKSSTQDNALFGNTFFADEPVKVDNSTDACGSCAACLKAQKYIHPDIYFTFPTIKKSDSPPTSKEFMNEWRKALSENPYMDYNLWLSYLNAENKTGNITVNECNDIIKRVYLKPYEAQSKIQIIWLAEFLREAGNTLLKVIEEPPSDTVFILVAESADAILNTILSRTQIVKLPPLDDFSIKDYLLKSFTIDEKLAEKIARISDGNLNIAVEFSNGSENTFDDWIKNWLSICIRLKNTNSHFQKEGSEKLLPFLDEIYSLGRENQKVFLKYFLWFLREVHLISLGLSTEKLVGDELAFAQKLAPMITPEKLEKIQKTIQDLSYHIERNGHARVLFSSASFTIASVFSN